MLKKDSLVKVKEVIKDKDKIEEVLKRTTWKAKVLDCINEGVNCNIIYKVVWNKGEYAVVSSKLSYYLVNLKNLFELIKGQKIILTDDYSSATKGMIGTIEKVNEGNCNVGVDFGKEYRFTHNLGGFLERSTGYYVEIDCIEPYDDFKELREKETISILQLTSKIEELTSKNNLLQREKENYHKKNRKISRFNE